MDHLLEYSNEGDEGGSDNDSTTVQSSADDGCGHGSDADPLDSLPAPRVTGKRRGADVSSVDERGKRRRFPRAEDEWTVLVYIEGA